MNKNKVTVYVGGRRLILVSSENEEYIKNIAKTVNERIEAVAKAYPQLDARGCAIMAALDYADDEKKALGKKAELVEQANKVLKQADKQSKQIIELKNKNSELDKKYDELLEKFEDLKKKNSNLTAQYNELKKFLDNQINKISQSKKEAGKTNGNLKADVSKKEQENSTNENNKNSEKELTKDSEKENKKPIAFGIKNTDKGNENLKGENVPKTNSQNNNFQKNNFTKENTQVNKENKENKEKNNPKNNSQNNPQNKNQYVFGKKNTNKPDDPLNEDIIKPETAADIMRKGYIPIRQYSLFDDEDK